MKENVREKWQNGLSQHLEPGERIESAARGMGIKFWQLALFYGYLLLMITKRFRTYIVTDRNVYVLQASSGSKYKAGAVLAKRPLGQARVELKGSYLTFDGDYLTYVGIAGPGKQAARALAESAAKAPGASPDSAQPQVA